MSENKKRYEPQETVQKYIAAWSEQGEAMRRRLLKQAWTDDGELIMPETSIKGREALVKHIGRFQRETEGARLVVISAVEVHHGLVRYCWELTNASGAMALDGVDFGELANDGRLRRIVTFYGLRPEEYEPIYISQATGSDKEISGKTRRYKFQVTKLTDEDISQKLAHFEQKYGMSSREFYEKYNSCQLEENLDYMHWAWYYDMAAKVGLINSVLEG